MDQDGRLAGLSVLEGLVHVKRNGELRRQAVYSMDQLLSLASAPLESDIGASQTTPQAQRHQVNQP